MTIESLTHGNSDSVYQNNSVFNLKHPIVFLTVFVIKDKLEK
jgi:hypothetical protein